MNQAKMKVNLVGRVKNMTLPNSKALMPLFEAIVNSIHSIEETGIADGWIRITIERNETQGNLLDNSRNIYPITSFKIADNGAGFNDDNFESFLTSDSARKVEKGAKGIGRFLWLKVFDSVYIKSIYKSDNKSFKREFKFLLQHEAVTDLLENVAAKKDICRTEVNLIGFKDTYRKNCPQKAETISKKIIEHCLVFFLSQSCPRIYVHDGIETFELNNLFTQTVEINSKEEIFTLKSKEFKIKNLKLYGSEESEHRIYFCGQDREVINEKLSNHISDLNKRLKDNEENTFTYLAYVTGEYLDERVNPERTNFNMTSSSEIDFPDEITLDELKKETISQIKNYLAPWLEDIKGTKFLEVQRFVTTKAPQYRSLLRHHPELLDNIELGLSEDKLDLALYKLNAKVTLEIKELSQDFLSATLDNFNSYPEYAQRYNRFIEQFNDFGKANLAQYIVHRKTLLELLDSHLKRDEDGNYKLEKHVHELIFPLKTTSDNVDFDRQNLWVIDEKLAYHKYLASDIKLSSLEGISISSDDRPDLVVFNHPFAFVEGEAPYASVVIVEFKRPMRKGYSEDENPINQVFGYISKIQEGNTTDKDGRLIPISKNIPFYAYIICDITPKIKEFAKFYGFTVTPDQMGYFNFNTNLNTYTEIISFDKLISDAKKRNNVLFEKLHLPVAR
ncbi:MAG: hypothetical protein LH649_10815 [Pseudanabaena sp. CAN_BIN31]|nr:hypothetical protein [Pseudanabaena sp. CAN_BIN31]